MSVNTVSYGKTTFSTYGLSGRYFNLANHVVLTPYVVPATGTIDRLCVSCGEWPVWINGEVYFLYTDGLYYRIRSTASIIGNSFTRINYCPNRDFSTGGSVVLGDMVAYWLNDFGGDGNSRHDGVGAADRNMGYDNAWKYRSGTGALSGDTLISSWTNGTNELTAPGIWMRILTTGSTDQKSVGSGAAGATKSIIAGYPTLSDIVFPEDGVLEQVFIMVRNDSHNSWYLNAGLFRDDGLNRKFIADFGTRRNAYSAVFGASEYAVFAFCNFAPVNVLAGDRIGYMVTEGSVYCDNVSDKTHLNSYAYYNTAGTWVWWDTLISAWVPGDNSITGTRILANYYPTAVSARYSGFNYPLNAGFNKGL